MLNVRFVPSCLLGCAPVVTLRVGVNASREQLAVWNGTATGLVVFSSLVMVPVMLIASQFVGLNVKAARLTVTLTALIWTGIPSMKCGMLLGLEGAVLTVMLALVGFAC